jgi:hypothetical protein
MELRFQCAKLLAVPLILSAPRLALAAETAGPSPAFGLNGPSAMVVEEVKTASPSATGSDSFTLAVNVGMWGASMNGDIGVRGLSTPVNVDFLDLIQDVNMAVMGGLELTKGNWIISFQGLWMQLSDDETLRDGRGADITADTAILDLGLGYTIVRAKMVNDMPITITPVVGVRWTYLSLEVDPYNFPAQDRDQNWFDPYVGGQVVVGLTRTLDWRTEASVGGFGVGCDFTWTVGSFFDWQFSEHVSLDVGYRCLSQNYDNDDFKWDMTLQGPWIGLTFQ